MKNLSKIIAVLTMLVFLLLPTQSAQAQDSTEPGKVVFGDSYTLESGETLEGDLVVFGGNVTIESDAVVTGSVVVFGGTIELEQGATIQQDTAMIGGTMDANGVVDGDLFIMGGRIVLNETAVIHGDISTMGGEVERHESAQVDGDIVENAPAPAVQVPTVPVVPGVPPVVVNPVVVRPNPLGQVGSLLGFSLIIAAFGMFLSLFLQPQFDRVSNSIIRQPLVAGSFGLLTVALTPFVVVILAVTVVLLPVAFLAVVAVSLAWLFGMIALGQEVGERFTRAVNQNWPPVLTVGFGTFFLTLITSSFLLLDGIPGMACISWIMLFLVGLVGIGGVTMTWFGTRLAPGAQPAAAGQLPVEVPPAS